MARRDTVAGFVTTSRSGSRTSWGPRIVSSGALKTSPSPRDSRYASSSALQPSRHPLVDRRGRGRHDQLTVEDFARQAVVRHVGQIVVAKLAFHGVAHVALRVARGSRS